MLGTNITTGLPPQRQPALLAAATAMSDLLDWLTHNDPSFRKSATSPPLPNNWLIHDLLRSRLPSLYSDLSLQRHTNPDGYSANITAWQTALTRAALAGQLPSGSSFLLHPSDSLLNALSSPQYGRPLGIGALVDESVRTGTMILLKDFLSADRSIYGKSWLPDPWIVLEWGLRQVGLAGTGNYDAAGGKRLRAAKFVLVQALEKVAADVVAGQQKRGQRMTDRVMSRESFAQDLASIHGAVPSDGDTTVLLKFLERDQQVLAYDDKVRFITSPKGLPFKLRLSD